MAIMTKPPVYCMQIDEQKAVAIAALGNFKERYVCGQFGKKVLQART